MTRRGGCLRPWPWLAYVGLRLHIHNPTAPTEPDSMTRRDMLWVWPWLGTTHSSPMDSRLIILRHILGSITIKKQANPVGTASFSFDGDLGSFSLKDGESKVFTELGPTITW